MLYTCFLLPFVGYGKDTRCHGKSTFVPQRSHFQVPMGRKVSEAGALVCVTEWERNMMKEVGAWKHYEAERSRKSIGDGEYFPVGLSGTESWDHSTEKEVSAKEVGVELLLPDSDGGKRCGFVALLGPSNVGKSTLLNKLVREKVAIVSRKLQTTRCRVLGVVLKGKSQIVLLDTPGVFEGRGRLAKAMVKAAWKAGRDADVGILVVDTAEFYQQVVNDKGELLKSSHVKVNNFLAEICKSLMKQKSWPMMSEARLVLCFNKVDLVAEKHREEVIQWIVDELVEEGLDLKVVRNTCSISARTGEGVEEFKALLADMLPEGPWLYPEDAVTDMPLRLMAAEVTRQYCFYYLDREVPYSLAAETTSWKSRRESVTIHQTLYVTRKSHKPIVMGKGGSMIKRIGSGARRELMKMFNTKVNLFLHVVVKENWKDMKDFYEPYGLDFKS